MLEDTRKTWSSLRWIYIHMFLMYSENSCHYARVAHKLYGNRNSLFKIMGYNKKKLNVYLNFDIIGTSPEIRSWTSSAFYSFEAFSFFFVLMISFSISKP